MRESFKVRRRCVCYDRDLLTTCFWPSSHRLGLLLREEIGGDIRSSATTTQRATAGMLSLIGSRRRFMNHRPYATLMNTSVSLHRLERNIATISVCFSIQKLPAFCITVASQ